MSVENPNFLKDKYNLHASDEVEFAAERTEARSGEKVPQNPSDRIQNYLNRFTEIIDRKDPDKRERGIEALKEVMYGKFVIKQDQVPESYFELQRKIAREQGHGDIEVTDEMKQQLSEVVIADQRSSLDTWVDYLASKDATYPNYLKYFAIRSIVGMGEYDKEKKQFSKRSKGTTKPFPDLNREALAYVLDAIGKEPKGNENFAKLYAYAIEKVTPASVEQITITEGKWVKYDQNSDHMPLVESLQGHGTGWCTAGESTAATQLQNGDFYVYYSNDAQGIAKVPRAAIRMEGDSIAEVRGIAAEQNLDPYIGDVVEGKLTEFGSEGEVYKKKSQDMKQLTAIEVKTKDGQELTKQDLEFLYEVNSPIEGFGYHRDPRIQELISQRDKEVDMPIVFECQPNQIARNGDDINANTKAFVGTLEPGIFQKISEFNIEHVYTDFPYQTFEFFEADIGGRSKENLLKLAEEEGIEINSFARQMIDGDDFLVPKEKKNLRFAKCRIKDLIDPSQSYDQKDFRVLYERILFLGGQLCPPDTVFSLPVKSKEYRFLLAMDPITISIQQIPSFYDNNPAGYYEEPSIFLLKRDDGKQQITRRALFSTDDEVLFALE